MRLLRMTTRRWMILVAVVAIAFGLLTFLRRLAAGKVASFTQKVRVQLSLPPDDPLSDFNVPLTRDVGYWMDIDHFLSRFWIVLLTVIVLATWVAIAYSPRGRVKASVPAAEPGEG
jgi:hypothetical protein